jgi:hypothetical protein
MGAALSICLRLRKGNADRRGSFTVHTPHRLACHSDGVLQHCLSSRIMTVSTQVHSRNV